jgi:hypothetical protein
MDSIILYDTSGLKTSLDAGLEAVPFSIKSIDKRWKNYVLANIKVIISMTKH